MRGVSSRAVCLWHVEEPTQTFSSEAEVIGILAEGRERWAGYS